MTIINLELIEFVIPENIIENLDPGILKWNNIELKESSNELLTGSESSKELSTGSESSKGLINEL